MASVSFAGQQFQTRDRIGAMPLMRFAKVARTGVDSSDMESLAVMYDLLRACIAVEDWPRFEQAADDAAADGDVLMQVVTDTVQALSARPTSQPSGSSGGLRITSPNFGDDSSSPVTRMLSGRPDLQLMVTRAQQARSA